MNQAPQRAPERLRAKHLGLDAAMSPRERHARGAHYTPAADIAKVLGPTIVRPWSERIAAARTGADLARVHDALAALRVLDPACGAGDFLIAALDALRRLEALIRLRLPGAPARTGPHQLAGIDVDTRAIEAARAALPGADLRCDDALFCAWPAADAIVGNPPFQSKNNMQQELGAAYVRRLRARHPDVPGRADYCVYWFRRAHDELPPGGRAGLVGTKTIRQNASREGGLDYILAAGGTITEAVSVQDWPGDASIHVSIVNWIKGPAPGKKKLFTQLLEERGRPWKVEEVDHVSAALTAGTDVTDARALAVNRSAGACHQGQTHGHKGFLLDPEEVRAIVRRAPGSREALFPILIGDDLLARRGASPSRYVIDFHPRDLPAARAHEELFDHVRAAVLPDREQAAAEEARRNEEVLRQDPRARVNRHHQNFLRRWWLLSYPREELVRRLAAIPRYVACSRVTKRPIFAFVAPSIRPGDALAVFTLPDDYSFGVLQSSAHGAWLTARCSTLGAQLRYTSESVFDTFPWPQRPTLTEACAIAAAAVDLRALRRRLLDRDGLTLRALYASAEGPAPHPLKDAHAALDAAVCAAYGMRAGEDALAFLLAQNHALAADETAGRPIVGPGLPPCVDDPAAFVTTDAVEAPPLDVCSDVSARP